ncbi:hypothetical protein BJ170DRAFT_715897 [Xylariales sp. AK1849]|nr:hypothetical protein BJ170DRAFT_715897 [Xylariales sp. AK1849]
MALRWVARGRKEEHFPSGTSQQTDTSNAYARIPATTVSSQVCASCKKTGAYQRCSGCHITEDGHLVFATYCDEVCQKKHWLHHKSDCRVLRQVYRASQVLRSIVVIVAEQACILLPCRSQMHSGGVVLLESTPHGEKLAFESHQMFHSFSSTGFDTAASADVTLYRTVFSLMSEAMSDWFRLMPPVFDEIEKVLFIAKNAEFTPATKITTRRIHFDSTFTSVLRAKLRPSGATIALDFCGRRFGWQEAVTMWEHFSSRRIKLTSRVIKDALKTMRDDGAATVSDFYKLKENAFNDCRTKMENRARRTVEEFMATITQKSLCRLYLDHKNHLQVTMTENEARKLPAHLAHKEQVEENTFHDLLINWRGPGDSFLQLLYPSLVLSTSLLSSHIRPSFSDFVTSLEIPPRRQSLRPPKPRKRTMYPLPIIFAFIWAVSGTGTKRTDVTNFNVTSFKATGVPDRHQAVYNFTLDFYPGMSPMTCHTRVPSQDQSLVTTPWTPCFYNSTDTDDMGVWTDDVITFRWLRDARGAAEVQIIWERESGQARSHGFKDITPEQQRWQDGPPTNAMDGKAELYSGPANFSVKVTEN